MTQTASVTGQKPTSVHMTFTIAVSAKGKGFGDFGNWGVIPVAFISGRSAKRKANTSTRARKNQRHSKQSLHRRCRYQDCSRAKSSLAGEAPALQLSCDSTGHRNLLRRDCGRDLART